MLSNAEFRFTIKKGTGSTGVAGCELETNLKQYNLAVGETYELPFIGKRPTAGSNDYPTIRFQWERISTGAKTTTREYAQGSTWMYFKVFLKATSSDRTSLVFEGYNADGTKVSLSNATRNISCGVSNLRFRVISYHADYSAIDNYEIIKPPEPEPVRYVYETERQIIAPVKNTIKTNRTIYKDFKAINPTYRIVSVYGNLMTYKNLSKRKFKFYEENTYEEIERGDIIKDLYLEADIKQTSSMIAEAGVFESLKTVINTVSNVSIGQADIYICPNVSFKVKTNITATSYVDAEAKVNINSNSLMIAEAVRVGLSYVEANIHTNSVLNTDLIIQPITTARIKTIATLSVKPMKIRRNANIEVFIATITKEYNTEVVFNGAIEKEYYHISKYEDDLYKDLYKRWADLSFSKKFATNHTAYIRKE